MIPALLKLSPKTPQQLSEAKRKLAAKFKIPIPTNSLLIKEYRKYIKKAKINSDKELLKILKRRGVRTGSGVAPVAILTKPYLCPGKCFYCPNEKGMPKSYLSNEPAVMRAILNSFDPYKQIHARLAALEANGHPTDKIEIIIMGGTWSYLPKNYQTYYIINCFKACNEFNRSFFDERAMAGLSNIQPINISRLRKKNKQQLLKKLQSQNEKSAHRIVGLTLETRPDYINIDEIKRMRELGCTRVELGAQAIDDKILSLNKRGHGVKEIINATKLLREAGFKICYHMMVNLPGSTLKKDFEMFKKLFSISDFQPDQIKIYPCVVTKNASLYKWYKNGKYIPYTEKQLVELLIKIKTIIPKWVRVIRVIRDIPSSSIEAGNKISNLRENLGKIMNKRKISCQCIRCREIGKLKIQSARLKIIKYKAADGIEYFLSYEDFKQNKIIAFLRLRLPYSSLPLDENAKAKFSITHSAVIREVHTYGPAVKISKKESQAAQHIGFGKKLIKKAEVIAQKNGYKKIAVISGVGARGYYRKLGYRLKNTYMIKKNHQVILNPDGIKSKYLSINNV
ncbi:MAG: tRNA uridine(34) 5-carboxymethylaminomethyl modification radical SAM/GNAT enzyme Elp3 [bacterium]